MTPTRSALRSALAAATLLFAGCAAQIQLTYLSDPPGATLYRQGVPVGLTPQVVRFPAGEGFEKQGQCVTIPAVQAKWASGAQTALPDQQICPPQGLEHRFLFVRPDVPGRDVDMNFALQLDRNRIMQEQAEAARQRAENERRRIEEERRRRAEAARQANKPTTCTTTTQGNTTTTTCR